MKRAGFTILEMLVAMFMFVLAVGGLALAMDKIFAANVLARRDGEVRQQIASLLDEAMVLPMNVLEEGRETESDTLGVRYALKAERAELRNSDDQELAGLWWVTVRADWTEGKMKQEWVEKFLRYAP